MTDTGTQNRDETGAGRENIWTQDKRDDSTSTSTEAPLRNVGESEEQYYARLEVWGKEEKERLKPLHQEGESIDDFASRISAIGEGIRDKVAAAKLKDKDVQLKDAAAKLKDKDVQLKEKDVQIEYHDKNCSVQQLLLVHSGLPEIQRNTKAEASMNPNGKRENENIDEDGNDAGPAKKTKGSFHKPAKILDLLPGDISSSLRKFQVNFYERGSNSVKTLVKSMLAASMSDDRDDASIKLSNFNESSPSLHVVATVKDVLNCLGLKADVAQEMSFFSMRPDIVVVKYMDVIVLIIEVKNQGRDGTAVMRNETAAGQCLDYSYALKKTGIDTPLVCLSTYSHMRIGSSNESISEILEAAVKRLQGVNEDKRFGGIQKKDKQQPSPEKPGNATVVIPCDFEVKKEDETYEEQLNVDGRNREIYFSETFERGNMFEALYLAVACGCISAERSQGANGDVSNLKRDPIPSEGQSLDGRWYNVVQNDSFTWTKVHGITATYTLKTSWQSNTRVFMGDILGTGRTGKVYMCMDSKGRQFALKMLFFDSEYMESYDPERRMNTRIEKMEILKKNLTIEALRWKKIYQEYESSIWEGCLNGLPALAMPYVASIATKNRNSFRDKIKNEMKRIAKLGFLYKKSDTRWRHIGLRMDAKNTEKIVFVDMESLEEIDKSVSVEERYEAVENFMSQLYGRA